MIARDVERRRQVVDDRVEQRLDALVLERGAAGDRRDRRSRCSPCGCAALSSSAVIASSSRNFSISSSSNSAAISSSSWRYSSASSVMSAGISPTVGLMPLSSSLKKIAFISTRSMMPVNLSSAPIGSWSSAGRGGEAVLHHLDDVEEVRAGAVHLVDVGDARDAVRVGLAPHRLGLRLDAADGAEDGARRRRGRAASARPRR